MWCVICYFFLVVYLSSSVLRLSYFNTINRIFLLACGNFFLPHLPNPDADQEKACMPVPNFLHGLSLKTNEKRNITLPILYHYRSHEGNMLSVCNMHCFLPAKIRKRLSKIISLSVMLPSLHSYSSKFYWFAAANAQDARRGMA